MVILSCVDGPDMTTLICTCTYNASKLVQCISGLTLTTSVGEQFIFFYYLTSGTVLILL